MPGRTSTSAFWLLLAMALGALVWASGPLAAQTDAVPTEGPGAVPTEGPGESLERVPDLSPDASLGPWDYESEPLTEELGAEVLAEAALTPEIMLLEPPLTDEDFGIFIVQYQQILFGTGRLNFREFARGMGVTLRRLNYLTAKITMPLGEPDRRASRINELGLGVLMNGGERELFLKHEAELTKLTEAMKRAITW